MGGWGARKSWDEGKPNCKTEDFKLLLPSAKVKQNNYGSGGYF
jgi:hypothetical protein